MYRLNIFKGGNPLYESQVKNRFLSFMLNEEIYGINVSHVEVVLEMQKITHIPKSPEFLCGVINHRGVVLPIVDIKDKFGLGKSDISNNSSIIILDIPIENDRTNVGILADSVKEVINIEEKDIDLNFKGSRSIHENSIQGIGKLDSNFIILINIEDALANIDKFKDNKLEHTGES